MRYNVRRFWIYVHNTKVKKGWNWVVLPDGTIKHVKPMKYLKIYSKKPLVFGFEDLTEEIGEKPDWDFNEPYCQVLDQKGVVFLQSNLKMSQKGGYKVTLFYGRRKIFTLGGGVTVTRPFRAFVNPIPMFAISAKTVEVK